MKHLWATLALLVVLAMANTSWAYPHFQFSSDTNACNLCHYAPAGGGMLTGWGRSEAADTLSRGGNGDVLHGLVELPDWLNLHSDIRLAGLAKETGEDEGTQLHAFPMQADLHARVEHNGFFVLGTVGLRGKRQRSTLPEGSSREEGGIASRIVSREHFIGYKGDDSKITYRAGRFYAPYGLRLPDHTSYIRRFLGFNVLEETYGLSASHLNGDHDLHASLHVSDIVYGPSTPSFGATAMRETRGDAHALGYSLRATGNEFDLKGFLGAHFKYWKPSAKLLLMAEVDAGFQKVSDDAGTQFVPAAAYVGPVWFPTQGVSATLAYEFYDSDLLTRYTEYHALTSWISVLPRAHYEIFLLGRAERRGPSEHLLTAMLQLHYYL